MSSPMSCILPLTKHDHHKGEIDSAPTAQHACEFTAIILLALVIYFNFTMRVDLVNTEELN